VQLLPGGFPTHPTQGLMAAMRKGIFGELRNFSYQTWVIKITSLSTIIV
jgi:hypothetical protein